MYASVQIPDKARWLLEKADGYLDISMSQQARETLQLIRKPYRNNLVYIELRLRLAVAEEDWDTALSIAKSLKDKNPENPGFWVQLAYVTRRGLGIKPARTILEDAGSRFRRSAIIPYNLGCYECQLGNLDRAILYLLRAFELDSSFQELALNDQDLEPLWVKLG